MFASLDADPPCYVFISGFAASTHRQIRMHEKTVNSSLDNMSPNVNFSGISGYAPVFITEYLFLNCNTKYPQPQLL